MVNLGVGPVQVLFVDQAVDYQVAEFGEAVDLFAGQASHRDAALAVQIGMITARP